MGKLFSDTGKLIDPDGLRSVQFNGRGVRIPRSTIDRKNDTKIVETLNEETGETVGHTTHHASGRVDANVNAKAVRASASTQ